MTFLAVIKFTFYLDNCALDLRQNGGQNVQIEIICYDWR